MSTTPPLSDTGKPKFKSVLRGYERRQVAAYIDQLHACLDELRRSPDTRVTPPPAQFTIVCVATTPNRSTRTATASSPASPPPTRVG